RRIGREQLAEYPSVELADAEILEVDSADGRFEATLGDGRHVAARKVILATGVRDELPAIEGVADLWGGDVFHCPYCHGWEVRDRPLTVLSNGAPPEIFWHMVTLIRNWSGDVVVLTDGADDLGPEDRERLRAMDVGLREEPIARLEHEEGRLTQVVFADGSTLPQGGVFVRPVQRPRNELAIRLGCELNDDAIPGLIRVDPTWQTTVPGVYAVGDVATPMQQIAMAVSSGAMAGALANHALVMDALG
ncbi:MAG: FAD-dependent pyridine nucleotide-disulfide oxidoreductase, partial [Thermomicrobiales bacterium]|nr:FAD-dependent pyridine nucleotide-disulfide oxidoreductase [Thermomicrobiales bacterium]